MRRVLTLVVSILAFAFLAGAVTPRDFGAVGDGIVDDTESLQLAVNETDTGSVSFPKGVYRITRTIVLELKDRGPVNLEGAGGGARVLMADRDPPSASSGITKVPRRRNP